FLADRRELVNDDLHQQAVARQNRSQTLDGLQQLRELVEDLLTLQSREALELHVEDGLRLDLREAELGDQAFAGLWHRLRRADERDDRVEVIERDLEPFENVISRLGLPQLEFGAAPHDVAAEGNEALDHLEQRHHLRAAADDRQHDDAEAQLQLR